MNPYQPNYYNPYAPQQPAVGQPPQPYYGGYVQPPTVAYYQAYPSYAAQPPMMVQPMATIPMRHALPKGLGHFQRGSLPETITDNSFDKPVSNILSQVQQETGASGKFTDANFPPDKAIQQLDGSVSTSVATEAEVKVDGWHRPGEICGTPALVESSISVNDILQGSLGDCWLLSAFASIAGVNPTFIERLLTKWDEAEGIFTCKLCFNGIWLNVVIDDLLPCVNAGNAKERRKDHEGFPFIPTFVGCPKGEFWPAFIEKAVAKLMGGYHTMQGGLASESLAILTGGVPTEINTETADPNMLWDKYLIRSDIHKDNGGCFMVASCRNNLYCDCQDEASYKKALKDIGLLPGHAYSVVTCRDVYSDYDGKSMRLICLRNPWGTAEWHGDWSDYDKVHWTPSMIKMLRKPIKDDTRSRHDGIFWIEYDDFLFYFNRLCVAEVFPSSWHSQVIVSYISDITTIESPSNPRWEIFSPADTSLTMISRAFDCDETGKFISDNVAIGTTVIDGATNTKVSRRYSNYSVVVELQLRAGTKYILMPGVYKGGQNPFNLAIRLISEVPLSVQRL